MSLSIFEEEFEDLSKRLVNVLEDGNSDEIKAICEEIKEKAKEHHKTKLFDEISKKYGIEINKIIKD